MDRVIHNKNNVLYKETLLNMVKLSSNNILCANNLYSYLKTFEQEVLEECNCEQSSIAYEIQNLRIIEIDNFTTYIKNLVDSEQNNEEKEEELKMIVSKNHLSIDLLCTELNLSKVNTYVCVDFVIDRTENESFDNTIKQILDIKNKNLFFFIFFDGVVELKVEKISNCVEKSYASNKNSIQRHEIRKEMILNDEGLVTVENCGHLLLNLEVKNKEPREFSYDLEPQDRRIIFMPPFTGKSYIARSFNDYSVISDRKEDDPTILLENQFSLQERDFLFGIVPQTNLIVERIKNEEISYLENIVLRLQLFNPFYSMSSYMKQTNLGICTLYFAKDEKFFKIFKNDKTIKIVINGVRLICLFDNERILFSLNEELNTELSDFGNQTFENVKNQINDIESHFIVVDDLKINEMKKKAFDIWPNSI